MARISTDGKHRENTADPRWQKEQEEKRRYQETYNAGGGGPTARQINEACARNIQKSQKLAWSEENLQKSGEHRKSTEDTLIQASRSWVQYKADIEADWAVAEEMEKDLIEYPENPELERSHDELVGNVNRREGTLRVYENGCQNMAGEYIGLSMQEEQDKETCRGDYEDWESDRWLYTMLLSDYRGNDMEELSEEALDAWQEFQEGSWEYVETEIDQRLEEIGEEIAETERKTGELYQSDPENALLGNVRIGNAIEKRKALENEAAALRTEKYLLEGEKKRSRQRLEAIRDPDFQKYVELGKAAEKEIYHETLINQAALQKSGVILPINTLDSFEDTGAMEPIDQKIYYYLWGKEGNETAAKSYKHSLERQINQKRSDEYLERIQKGAEEQPFRYGITSTLFRPTAAALTVGDMLKDWTSPEAEKGLLSDPNTPGKSMTRGIWAARQPGLDSIENPGAKKAANYMYNVVDMAPGAVLDALGTPVLGMAYRSMVRGTDGYVEAASQGATTEQALKEGKNRAAQGMFLENASQMAGNGQNNGFSRQPGDSQQGASLALPNSGQLSGLSEAEYYDLMNMLGTQGVFQYLMENNGYSMENILSRPSAQQAYDILRYAGLEPAPAQQLLKSNGYSLKNIVEPFSAKELQKLLREPGLDVETTKRLLDNGGYTSELPNLLKGIEGEEPLQRDEDLLGEFFELPKIGEDLLNDAFGIEKTQSEDYNEFAEKIHDLIRSEYSLKLHKDRQGKHIRGSFNFDPTRGELTADPEELIKLYAGKGEPIRAKSGAWPERERFTHTSSIGIYRNKNTGYTTFTNNGIFHYSKDKGIHITPANPDKGGISND